MSKVVVSGIGILTSIGWDVPSYAKSLLDGVSGVSEITSFDTTLHRTKMAAEIRYKNILDCKGGEYDRSLIYTKYVLDQALKDAKIDREMLKTKRVSVCIGTVAAGWATFERTFSRIHDSKDISPEDLHFSAGILSDFISAYCDLSGPKYTILTACSSGKNAIGLGYDLIKYDLADIVITGGVDLVTEVAHSGFNILRVLTIDKCKPFDKNRSGFAIGEAAGILILENEYDCKERHVKAHAEILGYGASCDAYHVTAPDPGGIGAAHAIDMALRKSKIHHSEVDYINAHGTATPQNDVMETRAIKKVFGKLAEKIPISSLKPLIGHTMGAAGAIEAIACIIMMKEGFLVPTYNYQTPDRDCDLDYITDGVVRRSDTEVALSNAFGFGGANCCLAIRRL